MEVEGFKNNGNVLEETGFSVGENLKYSLESSSEDSQICGSFSD